MFKFIFSYIAPSPHKSSISFKITGVIGAMHMKDLEKDTENMEPMPAAIWGCIWKRKKLKNLVEQNGTCNKYKLHMHCYAVFLWCIMAIANDIEWLHCVICNESFLEN